MTKTLTNRRILLIVTGSIAAYKSPDIIRRLQDLGASVRVVLSSGAAKFITEQTLQTISKHRVHSDLWDKDAELAMRHIELARWADLILVAPASANAIATLANGSAHNLFANIVLASKVEIIIAPAMNTNMLNNQAVSDNLSQLKLATVKVITAAGEQACGDIGSGRLADSKTISDAVVGCFYQGRLVGKNIIISAGSTIEAIDPVRYIANYSSGKMASSLAQICIEQGAMVTFIYGKIQIPLIERCQNIAISSADEMYQMVMQHIKNCDIFISAAAVVDYRIKKIASEKIKRSCKNLTLEFSKNIDILKAVCALKNKPLTVGFAAESEDLVANAKNKYQEKGCDLMIANSIVKKGVGFGADDNEVIILHPKGMQKISRQSKLKIAAVIIDFIADFLEK